MKNITTISSIIVILLTISLLFSFKSKKQEEEIIPCEEITLGCMILGRETQGEYVIKNNTDYQKLIQQKSPHSDCSNYQLPAIDFYDYTLIGYVSSVGGCDEPKVTHNVTKINNNYVVNVEIQQIGMCQRNNSIKTWCLIPKVQDNATVKFNVTKTLINKE